MEPSRLRTAVVLFLAIVFGAMGFWLGEAGGPPWAALPIVTGVVGCLVVASAVPGGRARKISVGVATIALYGLIFFAGLASFGHAFAECVERGETVRVLLSEFHRTQSVYPESLAQLGTAIPCDRISRPTILTYERTKNGYDLRFGDWLVEHTASEADTFMAHK
jgi:hypothetical protein